VPRTSGGSGVLGLAVVCVGVAGVLWFGLSLLLFSLLVLFICLNHLARRWFPKGAGCQCIAIMKEGIAGYKDGRVELELRWRDVRDLRLGGNRIFGFCLAIFLHGRSMLRMIPCGNNRAKARCFFERALNAWKRE
jgi:hypothetical protein